MDVASLTPLDGGWSGETFLGEAAGDRQVVRIYAGRSRARGAGAPEVDASVLRLVRGLVPVPEVLEARRAHPTADRPGLLVTSYVEGVRGDLLLPGLDEPALRVVGRHVGAVAATLGGIAMLREGAFVDADLRLGELAGADDLVSWARAHLERWPTWSVDERDSLLALAGEADGLLDTVHRRCLVHGDLNPKNLLLDAGTLEVVAVLDWEFAHAGHPFTDLGNVLRFERAPAYVAGVLEAYALRHRVERDQAVALARAADLWALIDLADRAGSNPVADDAMAQLRAVAASRDLSARAPRDS